jgi:hypothetical protein
MSVSHDDGCPGPIGSECSFGCNTPAIHPNTPHYKSVKRKRKRGGWGEGVGLQRTQILVVEPRHEIRQFLRPHANTTKRKHSEAANRQKRGAARRRAAQRRAEQRSAAQRRAEEGSGEQVPDGGAPSHVPAQVQRPLWELHTHTYARPTPHSAHAPAHAQRWMERGVATPHITYRTGSSPPNCCAANRNAQRSNR